MALNGKMRQKLLLALKDDLGKGDITSRILPEKKCVAEISADEGCVLAGLEEAEFLFKSRGLKVKRPAKDGQAVKKGKIVLRIEGSGKKIVGVERTALNFLGRMSGIATACNKAKSMLKKNSATKIALTRKTAPGLNLFDKKAAKIAGIFPHRTDLSSAVLIKDNHLVFFKSPAEAVKKAKAAGLKNIEVEVSGLKEALDAAKAGADTVMLDNFSAKNAGRAIKEIRKISGAKIELSGGITLSNLKQFAALNPDMISMGELTHSVKAVHFGLNVKKVL